MKRNCTALAIALLITLLAAPAAAFCGFYVSGADAELYNNATRVSLMREGKRTVLAMQNNYEGPPEDFAMVVPVPVVLEKEQVELVEDDIFDKLDTLSAPRLVEYWERDPCPDSGGMGFHGSGRGGGGVGYGRVGGLGSIDQGKGSVKVEAEYQIGEYNIVVLSSTESTVLEDWLTENGYNIPDGAAPYFRPYIQKGQYFFVAKVNMEKVEYEDGEAILSPIRFHYDSDDFVLPVRLGLINSSGAQDLIAFILARSQRYEVANLPNVTIPTNIPVEPKTKKNFGAFYQELFDNVLKENPQAVVTEYAWNAGKCDPCPGPTLSRRDLLSLGADALPRAREQGQRPRRGRVGQRDWVVTRLHTRYGKYSLGEDLVFVAAPGIEGGRGMPRGEKGTMASQQALPAGRNNFQGRYIIRHFWDGEVECENPRRGMWGGRNGGNKPQASAAENLAFSEGRSKAGLAAYIDDQPSIPGLKREVSAYSKPAGDVVQSWGKLVEPPKTEKHEKTGGASAAGGAATTENESHTGTKQTGGCASGGSSGSGVLLIIGLMGFAVVRRWGDGAEPC